MRSRKAATSARGWGWYRNKSRPVPNNPRQHIETRQSLSARPVRPGGLGGVGQGRAKALGALWAQVVDRSGKKRLHHNVLAIALANKLARIAWSVLAHGRTFEASKIQAA